MCGKIYNQTESEDAFISHDVLQGALAAAWYIYKMRPVIFVGGKITSPNRILNCDHREGTRSLSRGHDFIMCENLMMLCEITES